VIRTVQKLSWPAEERATQLKPLKTSIQRADARWLGGPVKRGHDNLFLGFVHRNRTAVIKPQVRHSICAGFGFENRTMFAA
jgi:hypothetical protein